MTSTNAALTSGLAWIALSLLPKRGRTAADAADGLAPGRFACARGA